MIVFVVSHDFEFIVRTCTEVVQLDDDGAIQNQRLSPPGRHLVHQSALGQVSSEQNIENQLG